jgi:hypothetical protein
MYKISTATHKFDEKRAFRIRHVRYSIGTEPDRIWLFSLVTFKMPKN